MVELLYAARPNERSRWLSLLSSWPGSPPVAFPSYLELFAAAEEEPALLVLEEADQRVVLPLLLRSVPGEPGVRDAVGPYGYGAAFDTGPRAPRSRFWEEAADRLRDEGIVSVVTRLPVVDDASPWPYAQHPVMTNVVRDIRPWAEMWTDVEHKVRKNYNKAVRSGVRVEFLGREGLMQFLPVYTATMHRRDASDAFLLTAARLGALLDELDDRFVIALAVADGSTLAAELVLVHGQTAFSFLGGTVEAGFPVRANDYLKCEIFRWCASRGVQDFVLGGGRGGEDDGILRYKSSFAPSGSRAFSIGEWRVDGTVYDRVVQNRSRREPGWLPSASSYPAYRA